MEKAVLKVLVLVSVIGLVAIGCGQQPAAPQPSAPTAAPAAKAPAAPAAKAAVEVEMNGDMPVGHFTTVGAENFAKQLTANGSVDVKFYPAGQLFADDVAPNALAKGTLQLAQMGVGGEIEALVPETIILSGPTYTDMDWFYRFMYDTKGGGGWSEKVLEPAFAKQGIKWLATSPYSPDFGVMTTKEVKSIEDYKGMKLRTPDKGYAAIFEALGASPVVMSSSDVYMGIQRNTIDGGVSGLTSFVSRKWFEVAKYAQTLGSGPNIQMLLANLEFWNSLSPEEQTSLMKAAKETELWWMDAAIKDHEASKKKLEDNGVTVTEFKVGTPEWEKLKSQSAPNVEKIMRDALKDNYDTTMSLFDATKNGTMTWKEAVESR